MGILNIAVKWRVARVAEEARLESVYRVKLIEGSNPSLSSDYKNKNPFQFMLERIFYLCISYKLQ